MITNISVSHYRSIFHADLHLNRINLIVGANGSGKSNIIDAIYFLHDCCTSDVETALTKRHGIDSVRQWSKTRPFHISIELYFASQGGWGRYKVVLASAKGDHRVIEESGEWNGPHPFAPYSADEEGNHVAPSGRSTFFRGQGTQITFTSDLEKVNLSDRVQLSDGELFLTTLNAHFYSDNVALFYPIAQELSSFALYSIYPNTLRQPQVISRERSLMENGSNLASILKAMSSKSNSRGRSDIISGIKAIMPSAEDYRINSAGGFYVPTIRVREPNGEAHDFGLSQISDGTLRALGILTALYQPSAPNKIAMEEPEQMIHPGALIVLSEAIKEFSSAQGRRPDRQIFVTTHSPHLIDMFEPEDLIWTRKVNGLTEAGHVPERQMGLIKESLFTAGELLLSEGIF